MPNGRDSIDRLLGFITWPSCCWCFRVRGGNGTLSRTQGRFDPRIKRGRVRSPSTINLIIKDTLRRRLGPLCLFLYKIYILEDFLSGEELDQETHLGGMVWYIQIKTKSNTMTYISWRRKETLWNIRNGVLWDFRNILSHPCLWWVYKIYPFFLIFVQLIENCFRGLEVSSGTPWNRERGGSQELSCGRGTLSSVEQDRWVSLWSIRTTTSLLPDFYRFVLLSVETERETHV